MDLIYFVEDDDSIRELVLYTLENTGFAARGCADGAAFRALLGDVLPQLVLLDIMLPGEDGTQILSELRADPDTADIPVIMVTAKGNEYDKVTALDMGADDYVTKPFGMMELVSRIRAVLRRSRAATAGSAEAAAEEVLESGPIRMNLDRHKVWSNGEELSLTLKEYELLRKLLASPGVVLTRDQILEDIWGYEFDGETRTVDVHVRTLRSKLGSAGSVIETVRGVGYRLASGVM